MLFVSQKARVKNFFIHRIRLMEGGLITNKVAESSIEILNLADLHEGVLEAEFDLAEYLFHGLILKEKEFRMSLKEIDWTSFEGKIVSIYCSTDAIIPTWASMLVASRLRENAVFVGYGDTNSVREQFFTDRIARFDWKIFDGVPVVVKGCGDGFVTKNAYLQAVNELQAHASKIMYGEPCSSVPIWRKQSRKENSQTSVAVKVTLPNAVKASIPTGS